MLFGVELLPKTAARLACPACPVSPVYPEHPDRPVYLLPPLGVGGPYIVAVRNVALPKM